MSGIQSNTVFAMWIPTNNVRREIPCYEWLEEREFSWRNGGKSKVAEKRKVGKRMGRGADHLKLKFLLSAVKENVHLLLNSSGHTEKLSVVVFGK